MHTYPVGADDSVRPQTAPVFTGIYGESVAAQRADVGIGPYRTPANPYFPASFERKAFLQQILNRSYSQIWCTITGGAYQIARRVSPCVRNGYKTGASLNRTRSTHQTVPQRPFSPPSFPARRKRRGRRRRVRNDHDGTNPCRQGFLSSVLVSSFPNRKLNLRFGFHGKFATTSQSRLRRASSPERGAFR